MIVVTVRLMGYCDATAVETNECSPELLYDSTPIAKAVSLVRRSLWYSGVKRLDVLLCLTNFGLVPESNGT